jgi:hypothetical protein
MRPQSLIGKLDVPAREARLVELTAGERVRVITETGGQVGDVFAFVADDLTEHLSAAHTRAHVNRLFPAVGEQFVTTRRKPILTLAEDTSPGRHDMLIPACDPARYRALGVTGWHASCAENLRTAIDGIGHQVEVVPQPVNIFMNIPVSTDGELTWKSSLAEAGAAITFEAVRDCVVVVSACPQDLVDISGGEPESLLIELEGSIH